MRTIFVFLLLLGVNQVCLSQLKVTHPQCENRINPIGLDNKRPAFSWQLTTSQPNTLQSAYEIRVSDQQDFHKLCWKSGKIFSDSSVHVAYKGDSLTSEKRYYWHVRVWDNHHNASAWSAAAFWQMGLLHTYDWKAHWIRPSYAEDPVKRPSPVFQKEFNSRKQVASAMAYITAHGLYEARINGQRVGDAYLTPGWTSYTTRLQYQCYDVTRLLKDGDNTISAMLGSGWYRGDIQVLNNYGSHVALLFQLKINYTDGSSVIIGTDDNWKCATSPITYAEIYHGETYDARLMQPKQWYPVEVIPYPMNNLVATVGEPVRKHEMIKPVRIFVTPKGEQVIDFGQNLVGWVMAKLDGTAGDSIKLSHAEVLDKDGNFYTANLRAAKAQNIYIPDGKGPRIFEPHFSWQGFRYVKVEGLKKPLKPEDFTAVALYSDLPQTGVFSCSDAQVNQLQHNIQWSQKGNFVDIPTDCPQRDERLGWTADAQVFSRTASFNMDVSNFFAKWMKDAAADQGTDGSVALVIPKIRTLGTDGVAGWADFMTVIPWNMYLAYGDKNTLSEQYRGMKKWVNYVHGQAVNNIWKNNGYGDWLSYNPGKGPYGTTDPNFVAQCFYAHSTRLLINAAKVLNKKDDVQFYTALLDSIKSAFNQTYVKPDGILTADTQTGYVLALQFDLLPEAKRQAAVKELVKKIRNFNNHLTTGFIGTPYICHVLSRFGRSDVAYQLLLQDSYPSWLYPVTKGATTIWERWDGIKPDGSFEDASMNSFNHYAYGAVGDWLYRVAAGIDTYEDQPGFKHIRIKPVIGGGLTRINASLQTYYGEVISNWKLDGNHLQMQVNIPANTTATIFIPQTASRYKQVERGSGTYTFNTIYQ